MISYFECFPWIQIHLIVSLFTQCLSATGLWASWGQEGSHSSLSDSRVLPGFSESFRNHSISAPQGVFFAWSYHRSLSVFFRLLLEVLIGTAWRNQVLPIEEEVGASLSFINISFLDPFSLSLHLIQAELVHTLGLMTVFYSQIFRKTHARIKTVSCSTHHLKYPRAKFLVLFPPMPLLL